MIFYKNLIEKLISLVYFRPYFVNDQITPSQKKPTGSQQSSSKVSDRGYTKCRRIWYYIGESGKKEEINLADPNRIKRMDRRGRSPQTIAVDADDLQHVGSFPIMFSERINHLCTI